MISPSRLLLLLDRERQARCQQVGQSARLAGIHRRDLKLFGDLLALVDHPLEEPVNMMHHCVELNPLFKLFLQRLDLADEIRLGLDDPNQPRPVLPLADDPGGAVRELEHLEDGSDADRRIKVVHPRLVDLRMKLAGQPHQPLANEHVVDQSDAAGPVDHQRHDRLREHNVRTQWQERQSIGATGQRTFGLLENQLFTGSSRGTTGLGPIGTGLLRLSGSSSRTGFLAPCICSVYCLWPGCSQTINWYFVGPEGLVLELFLKRRAKRKRGVSRLGYSGDKHQLPENIGWSLIKSKSIPRIHAVAAPPQGQHHPRHQSSFSC